MLQLAGRGLGKPLCSGFLGLHLRHFMSAVGDTPTRKSPHGINGATPELKPGRHAIGPVRLVVGSAGYTQEAPESKGKRLRALAMRLFPRMVLHDFGRNGLA